MMMMPMLPPAQCTKTVQFDGKSVKSDDDGEDIVSMRECNDDDRDDEDDDDDADDGDESEEADDAEAITVC